MKITDKIVTQVEQPSMTNVVWHNPDTNALKIYSNNDWKVVSGGIPIVTVEDNFNSINVKPNIFYNIKNPVNQTIAIQWEPVQFAPTKIYFTYDANPNNETESLLSDLLQYNGLDIIQDNTSEEYKYKAVVDFRYTEYNFFGICTIYFENDIIQGGSNIAYLTSTSYPDQRETITMNNINIIRTENVVNEYIFNVNCPCSIQFLYGGGIINWDNNDIPDVSQEGVLTISIVNGVGCYTFVKY